MGLAGCSVNGDLSNKVGNASKLTDPESSEFSSLAEGLKSVNNFSNFMLNEIKDHMNDGDLEILLGDVDTSLDDDYYKLTINETSLILNEDTELIRMSWIVGDKGKRGTGYTREPNMPRGMEKGHIKSVQEGAQDNSIEDSPLNIIPQTKVVNDPNIKKFENYRVDNCQGDLVITTILSKNSIQVEIPSKNINVTYDPYSNKELGDNWWLN